ncbi:hypothetical protein D9757_008060 [Collybiopsis confluens]|uniref:Uncharacterized protein n=1 Tax=Collybiopsis confluens TaxID=2823264 RepID=A0A8H5M1V2_9AGAR|nr:hypothetical protein D9757_008060 [Collybiopsis confluens]
MYLVETGGLKNQPFARGEATSITKPFAMASECEPLFLGQLLAANFDLDLQMFTTLTLSSNAVGTLVLLMILITARNITDIGSLSCSLTEKNMAGARGGHREMPEKMLHIGLLKFWAITADVLERPSASSSILYDDRRLIAHHPLMF